MFSLRSNQTHLSKCLQSLYYKDYTFCTQVLFCLLHTASYLPRPGAVEYQFAYVDKMGEVCARSRPFTFCAPKPLEELETLKEEDDGEDGEEELLLVIPRAQLLQVGREKSFAAKQRYSLQCNNDNRRTDVKPLKLVLLLVPVQESKNMFTSALSSLPASSPEAAGGVL